MAARLQWQEVMGTSDGPDAAETVKSGAFLGRFIGLKHMYSTDQRPIMQVGPSHPNPYLYLATSQVLHLCTSSSMSVQFLDLHDLLFPSLLLLCWQIFSRLLFRVYAQFSYDGMQALLVGLPLTALVAGLALALWRLAGPVSLRPGRT